MKAEKIKKKLRDGQGFTLIEIMLVVIIIGLLAAIGIPRYTRYLTEAKCSEARQMMGGIIQGEKLWRERTGSYAACADKAAISTKLRVDVDQSQNFDYQVVVPSGHTPEVPDPDGLTFNVQASVNAAGADYLGVAAGKTIYYYYPPPVDDPDAGLIDGWDDHEIFE